MHGHEAAPPLRRPLPSQHSTGAPTHPWPSHAAPPRRGAEALAQQLLGPSDPPAPPGKYHQQLQPSGRGGGREAGCWAPQGS